MKKLLVVFILLTSLFGLSACGNKQIIDTKWNFTRAKVIIGDQVEEYWIKSWNDYSGSDMIQITLKNGVTILTHSSNVILLTGE